jgi:hypothetical protein
LFCYGGLFRRCNQQLHCNVCSLSLPPSLGTQPAAPLLPWRSYIDFNHKPDWLLEVNPKGAVPVMKVCKGQIGFLLPVPLILASSSWPSAFGFFPSPPKPCRRLGPLPTQHFGCSAHVRPSSLSAGPGHRGLDCGLWHHRGPAGAQVPRAQAGHCRVGAASVRASLGVAAAVPALAAALLDLICAGLAAAHAARRQHRDEVCAPAAWIPGSECAEGWGGEGRPVQVHWVQWAAADNPVFLLCRAVGTMCSPRSQAS